MSQWVINWDLAAVLGSTKEQWGEDSRSMQALSNRDGPPSSMIAAMTEHGAEVSMSSCFTREARTLNFLCEISQFLNLGSIFF